MANQFFETVENPDLSKVTRIFMPLMGDEVIEAIGEHVKNQLRGSGKFTPALVYEEVVWRGVIEINWKGYSENLTIITPSGELREHSEPIADGATVAPEIPPAPPVRLSGEDKVAVVMQDKNAPPDKIREVTKQAIPVLLRSGHSGSGGATVKVPAGKLAEGNKGGK